MTVSLDRRTGERRSGTRERVARAERLFELSHDLLGAAGIDGHLTFVNPAWQRTLGWTDAELTGRPYIDFVHPGDRPAVLALADRIAASSGAARGDLEVRVRTRSGAYRAIRFGVAGATDEPVVYVCGKDVTEQREAVNALHSSRSELERSNAELSEYAAVVSHDLATPLGAVSGFLELLEHRQGERLDDDGRQLLAGARDGTTRMRGLITDVLAYARIGQSPRPQQAVPLEPLVRRLADTIRVKTPGEPPRIEWSALPVLRADPRELEQLLQNLLANAVKFVVPDLRPEVRVSARRIGPSWEIAVADNGIGVHPADAERIFMMFRRVHGMERYPGSGIGLAIARKVVEHAGGRLWVEPREDGGSRFCFTWPAD
jgi:PAS domain S-box-containing protein